MWWEYDTPIKQHFLRRCSYLKKSREQQIHTINVVQDVLGNVVPACQRRDTQKQLPIGIVVLTPSRRTVIFSPVLRRKHTRSRMTTYVCNVHEGTTIFRWIVQEAKQEEKTPWRGGSIDLAAKHGFFCISSQRKNPYFAHIDPCFTKE